MGNTDTKKKNAQPFSKKITWFFAVVLVVVIILLMALPTSGFGLITALTHRNDYVFGYYGNKKIEYAENSYLRRNYENMERQYSQYINENNRDSMSMFIWQQAFQNAAVMTALDYMAEKAGVYIPDEAVDKEITRLLTDENGTFQRDYWASLSSSERKSIRESVKSDLVRMQVVNDITASYVPDSEVEGLKTLSSYTESTDSAIRTSVEDSTTQRIVSAVLASPLYKDNFMEVYNKRIRAEQPVTADIASDESTDTTNESVESEATVDNVNAESSTSEVTTTESSSEVVQSEPSVTVAPDNSTTISNSASNPSASSTSSSATNRANAVLSTGSQATNSGATLSTGSTVSSGSAVANATSNASASSKTAPQQRRVNISTSRNNYRTAASIIDIGVAKTL